MQMSKWLVILGAGALLALPAYADGKKKSDKAAAAEKPCDHGKDGDHDKKPCDHAGKPCDHAGMHGDHAGKPCEGKGETGGCCPGCANKPRLAAAILAPTAGNKVKGSVTFAEAEDGKVTVTAELEGLNAGQQHAMHVHEFGDCSAADGASAGGHFNPEGHDHGLPATEKRHAGDFGNVTADAAGKAKFSLVVDNLTVSKWNGVAGRSVIVHAKADDGGQPTGNAGGRVACGVIGVAKGAEVAKPTAAPVPAPAK